ncbi:MAG: hypothetical protein STHCBS139747_001072 [Sporothrix thermara]
MGANGIESVDGSLDRAKYLQIHPLGNVPCLVVDGHAITEAPAILAYIAGLVPDKHLLGDSPLQQAWAHSWNSWLAWAVQGRGFGALFKPTKFSDDVSTHPAIQAKAILTVKDCLSTVEGRLAARNFPVGEHETVVDFYLVIFYIWACDAKFDMAAEYPAYSRLYKRMMEKESVRGLDLKAKPGLLYVPQE